MILEQRSVTVFWIRLFLIIMVFGLAVGYIGTRFIKVSSGTVMAQQRDDVAHIILVLDQLQKKQSLLETEQIKLSQQLDTTNKRLTVMLDGMEELLHQKDVETGAISPAKPLAKQPPVKSQQKFNNTSQNGSQQ